MIFQTVIWSKQDFPVDYESIGVDDILDIQKYLMNKNSMFGLIKKTFVGLLSFSGSLPSMVNVSDHTKCISYKKSAMHD